MFDIFLANDLREPLKLGSANSFDVAQSRMEHAKERPGWYFIWDRDNLKVIARIDTTNAKAVHA